MQYSTIQELINGSFRAMSEGHVLIQQRTKKVTAGELQKGSRLISKWILEEKLGKGTAIAILMEDRIEMIACILGILEAACVFVPLETNYPADAIKEMLQIANVQIVLTEDHYEKYNSIFEKLKIRVINIKKLQLIVSAGSSEETDVIQPKLYSPGDPIYIYFTSGTTNEPKAILGQNKGLTHFIEWESEKVGYIKAKVSQLTSPGHDPFLRDIFLAIKLGGTICIPDSRRDLLDGRLLLQWIRDSEINIMHCTPGLFNHMLMAMDKSMDFPELQYIFFAGEKVNSKMIKKWFQMASGNFQLKNLYGPTETTLAKLCYDIAPEDGDLQNIPIGKPINGAEVLILNECMQLCNVEEIGEIYIRTPYRSLGYLGKEEMNKRAFVPNPFNEDKNDIIYRTGDMGRRLADGNIEFIGRKDSQVKIRGNRVELSCIEHYILELEHIKECAVIFHADETGEEYISAYIVSESTYTKARVINFLKTRMPDYMLPAYIVFLDALPLNNNMKIDKRALPDPRCIQEETIVHPQNGIENKLADIFKNILKVKQISITDSFLTLGGTSLDVMSLISQVFDAFQVEISLEDVFNSTSLEEFAGLIAERLQAEEAEGCRFNEEGESCKLITEEYSIEEYSRKLNENYRYMFPSNDLRENKIEGIQPFNDVFYQSCVSNSLFSIINYYNADVLSFFVKDIILYGSAKDIDMPGKVEYLELASMEKVLEAMGIGVDVFNKKDNIIQELIRSIDKQRPVIIGVDCFYETIRPEHYKKTNWPHNLLVYGYDSEKQEMTVLEHTGINNLDYHEQKLSYLDLEFAYHNNRLKFRNFEKGRHYMEFYKLSEYTRQGVKVYYRQYRNNIGNNLEKIITDLNNLPDIIDNIKKCTADMEQIKKYSANLLNLLDSILEAKSAQIYLFYKFSEYDAKLQKGIEYLKIISKSWKLIRNVVYRTKLTNEYSDKSYENACLELGEIYDAENEFYRWFNNPERV